MAGSQQSEGGMRRASAFTSRTLTSVTQQAQMSTTQQYRYSERRNRKEERHTCCPTYTGNALRSNFPVFSRGTNFEVNFVRTQRAGHACVVRALAVDATFSCGMNLFSSLLCHHYSSYAPSPDSFCFIIHSLL